MNENETVDFQVGQLVRISPSASASADLIDKVRKVEEKLGTPVIGTVGAVFSNGACTVVLPNNMAIAGHSRRLSKDTEYIELARVDLEVVL